MRWLRCGLGALGVLSASVMPSAAQDGYGYRYVLANNVGCREAPMPAAPVLASLGVGEIVIAHDSTADRAWYLDRSRTRPPGCWLPARLLAPAVRADSLLKLIVAHALQREPGAAIEDFVAVDNFLHGKTANAHDSVTLLDTSAVLQLAHLHLLQRAARAPEMTSGRVRRAPLVAAWVRSAAPDLRYFEPGDGWYVTADAYWRLFERQRSSPIAEEIAWAAATAPILGDECMADCLIREVARTHGRYWREFPQGRWMRESVALAGERLTYAASVGCEQRDEATVQLILDLQRWLADVVVADKSTVLSNLDVVTMRCRERHND